MDKNLEKVTALISQHRQSKKGAQYPAMIWESVSGLRKQHTVVEISRRTGIHPSLIYKWTNRRQIKPIFREVKLVPPVTALVKPVAVELRRSDGVEVRFKIEASVAELSGLFLEFLR